MNQVGVIDTEYKKELIWENCGGREYHKAEQGDPTSDLEIERTQLSPVLTAGERGNENISQQICQHDKDHGEPAERAHFRDRAALTREKADEKNGDLALKTIEDSVGGLAANETEHGFAIVGVLRRAKIDHPRAVTAEQKILQKNDNRRHGDGDASVQENEGQKHKNR